MIKFVSKPFSVPNIPLLEQALNHFRIAIDTLVRDINRCPLTSGNHLKSQSVTTSWAVYNHNLNRVPTGWVVTYYSDRITVAEDIDLRTDKSISLRGSGSATVDIWVF